MSKHAVAENSIVKREPVMVASTVAWLLLQVGAILVGRLGLLSGEQWSAMASAIEPVVTGVVVTAGGLIVRRYVTPVWSAVKRDVVPAVQAVAPDPVDGVVDGVIRWVDDVIDDLEHPATS